MVLAFAGAALGNLVVYGLGYEEITGFSLRTVLISVLGATIILGVYRAIRSVAGKVSAPPPSGPSN